MKTYRITIEEVNKNALEEEVSIALLEARVNGCNLYEVTERVTKIARIAEEMKKGTQDDDGTS